MWHGLFRTLQSLIYRGRPRRKLGPILPASQEMARGFRTAMDFTHSFDIVLFAMIAAFLILRLRSVLGRRTGNERRRDPFMPRAEATGEKVVTLTPRPNGASSGPGAAGGEPVAGGIAQIRSADPEFDAGHFV